MTIIRVIDLETTGMELPAAQVCEVGICDVILEEKRVSIPTSRLCGVASIPPDARAIHHITLADVTGCDPFSPAEVLQDGIGAFASHGADFDTKFFKPGAPVICTYKSALRVWPDAPGHSNQTLRYWLEDQRAITVDPALAQPAHRAGPDAYVTAHVLSALFAAGITGRQMVQWTKEPRVLPRCPIGKFRGRPWSEVEGGFLDWMTRQADMEEDLKWNARREIDRRSREASA